MHLTHIYHFFITGVAKKLPAFFVSHIFRFFQFFRKIPFFEGVTLKSENTVVLFQTPLRQNLEEIREKGWHTKLESTSQVHDSEEKIR